MSALTQKAAILEALVRLSSARREKLDAVDYATFVDGLVEFAADDVNAVCRHLGLVAPGEYEPRFPPLFVLRQACIDRQRARQPKLTAPSLAAQYPPLSDEQRSNLRRLLNRALGRTAMPPTGGEA